MSMHAAAPRLFTVLAITLTAVACNREQSPANTNQDPTAAAPSTAAPPNPGRDLATGVRAAYYTDDTIRAEAIDVSAEQGVITLRGAVRSDAAKQHAVALARNVEGVTRVNDQLTVQPADGSARTGRQPAGGEQPAGTAGSKPADATDTLQAAAITTSIQAKYFLDPDIKPWTIDVSTATDGTVTLEGTVDDEGSKAEALRIAKDAEGVTRVVDRIAVESGARPAGTAGTGGDTAAMNVSEGWLTAKIQAKYFTDPDVKARNIDVDVNGGVAVLRGTVATDAERRQAATIARNTEGIREVTNELRVDASTGDRPLDAVPTLSRPDPWITMKIQSKYFLDPEVKGYRIDVDTREGLVTLTGEVASEALKKEAEQIARETEGVRKVVNQLKVGSITGN
jgi:osmotically-inducible protein OsmY